MALMARGAKGLKKLNIGCGKDIKDGFVNVDSVGYEGVDKVVDLTKFPWPFKANQFDHVYCSHILEHLREFHKTVMELHRICKQDAIIEIFVPYFMSTKFFGEPDHKIPFSYRSFDNYTAPRKVTFYNKWRLAHATNYLADGKFPFKTIDKKYIFDRNQWLNKLGFFHNLAPMYYERFFPSILPPMEVYFKLGVLKS